MNETWNAFVDAVREWHAVRAADALSGWDQETMLAPGGQQARATQRGYLQGVAHGLLTGPRLGELLASAEALTGLDAQQQALVRVVRRDREQETKLPLRLVRELANAQGAGVEAWKVARATSNFAHFAPHLERLVALRREEADARGHSGERYDALLDVHEPGMTVARLAPVLERLRVGLVDIIKGIGGRRAARADLLSADAWDIDAQENFSRELLAGIGFDLHAGRFDRSVHPFCSGITPTDVRLTTRLFRNDITSIFTALHEGGHGLYEQGLPDDGTPLAAGASMGIHESQSRLWENLVGRSRAFWTHWYPKLRARFPAALEGVSLDAWVDAINDVKPSLIRVDADEVTYNLHVALRFEIERALLDGRLAVKDLPSAWNDGMERLLGVRPPDDARGCLQDIHWAWGEFGYFPTYSIGNLYAAMLIRGAERALPSLWDDVARGEMQGLRNWLRDTVHRRGRGASVEEIVRDACGATLSEEPFLAYLRGKYLRAA